MKEKYYCKQVDPMFQDDNLFYRYRNDEGRYSLGWNDEIYAENVIIHGNDDYLTYHIKPFKQLLKADSLWYEYEMVKNPKTNGCYWKNITEFVNYYFPKVNGKYSTKEIHKWKELLEKSFTDMVLDALKLMTGKTWRKEIIRGCMQREWQYIYVSEEVSNEDVRYIEMCYFNTGSEWLFYESKEDMDNDNPSTGYYVDSYNPKQRLCEHIGCSEEELVCYEFDGYTKTPKYKEI